MKFITAFLLTAFLSYVGGLYMDWWVISIVAFIVAAIIPQKPLMSFVAGFSSLFLLWGAMAWMKDTGNEHLLSSKVAELLFKSSSSVLLVLVTAFIAGLVGGFAALTASFIRKKEA
ncbi:MAG TPA: hypothetical protein VFV46_02905 [Lacibacter sp.]|nr:hypothetical protein [Lacibacter sp.]